jgi:hypothetical protein
MWRRLPQQGEALRELRLEGGGRDREVVIVPRTGGVLRFPSTTDAVIELVGHVYVRTSTGKGDAVRVTFSGRDLVLERAEVEFQGSEVDWDGMWRRARMRSRPWWNEGEADEIDLDWAMPASLLLTAR